ncbi:MAG: hypothetical protein AAFP00_07450 [Bacteroidota bacterium]
MLSLITPPHVELSFYTGEIPDKEAIAKIKSVLTEFDDGVVNDPSASADSIVLQNLISKGSKHVLKQLEPIMTEAYPQVFRRVTSLISSEAEVTQTRKQATKLLELFKYICSSIDPSYATITTEYTLETPFELCQDDRSYAFKDFYLSSSYLKTEFLEKIRESARTANIFTEELQNGFVFLTGFQLIPKKFLVNSHKVEIFSSLVIDCIKRMECYKFS